MRTTSLLAALFVGMSACGNQGSGDVQTGAKAEPLISDQTHHDGTPGFFFLPPLVPPATHGQAFSRGLSPVVVIDELGGRGPIATFTRTSGLGDARVLEGPSFYIVVWPTRLSTLNPALVYRVRVQVQGFELGFIDMKVVTSAGGLIDFYRTGQQKEYAPVFRGLALPIPFRIEPAALSCVGVVCAAPDECHDVGSCNPHTGTCVYSPRTDGTACDDGDGCTVHDVCVAGACRAGDPVVCTATDACHLAGTCDPSTGTCTNPDGPSGRDCIAGQLGPSGGTLSGPPGTALEGFVLTAPPGAFVVDASVRVTLADPTTFSGGLAPLPLTVSGPVLELLFEPFPISPVQLSLPYDAATLPAMADHLLPLLLAPSGGYSALSQNIDDEVSIATIDPAAHRLSTALFPWEASPVSAPSSLQSGQAATQQVNSATPVQVAAALCHVNYPTATDPGPTNTFGCTNVKHITLGQPDGWLPTYLNLEPRPESLITGVVIHSTAGSTLDSAICSGMTLKPGFNYYRQAHYYIAPDGYVVQLIPDGFRANHAPGYNTSSIGIELVQKFTYNIGACNHDPSDVHPITEAQYASLRKLLRGLKDYYRDTYGNELAIRYHNDPDVDPCKVDPVLFDKSKVADLAAACSVGAWHVDWSQSFSASGTWLTAGGATDAAANDYATSGNVAIDSTTGTILSFGVSGSWARFDTIVETPNAPYCTGQLTSTPSDTFVLTTSPLSNYLSEVFRFQPAQGRVSIPDPFAWNRLNVDYGRAVATQVRNTTGQFCVPTSPCPTPTPCCYCTAYESGSPNPVVFPDAVFPFSPTSATDLLADDASGRSFTKSESPHSCLDPMGTVCAPLLYSITARWVAAP